ncbi:hypothetical protein N7478_008206 [Penicillium angulare]|uniref:uncharacterized protein n=1 Tax=Penicillium angulare TaxID=116970 RepID=UPI002542519F|nr:uncharacterized protein N7478_008206 [Penicillium angulare]KAJ5273081.1 hypothetical protein N7478_008206 [Penicillium angulare]
MRFSHFYFLASSAAILQALAAPTTQASLKNAAAAVPGQSELFASYQGKKTPLAEDWNQIIHPTASGDPGPDDQLFQNLLSAEWVIYNFYQEGVDTFTQVDFTKAGLPKNTYERLKQIRDNEAGHIRIFQDQISGTSLKPGPCTYDFGYNKSSPLEYLGLQVYIEVTSQAFLTGLALEAVSDKSKAALMAIGQTETRHNVWGLMDTFGVSPMAGPSDTTYPYAEQILELTNSFITKCPSENPVYPSPRQELPQIAIWANGTTGAPGDKIQPIFYQPKNQPKFEDGKDYWAVFFHGIATVNVPYTPGQEFITIPNQFENSTGIIIMNIADTQDSPTAESVVAGPLVLIEQPRLLTLKAPSVVSL